MNTESEDKNQQFGSLNIRYQEDFNTILQERFLPSEKVELISNCAFINHTGYLIISSKRFFLVSYKPFLTSGRIILSGRKSPPMGLFFPEDTLFLNPLGWLIYPTSGKLSSRELKSRRVWEIKLDRILGVNLLDLLAQRRLGILLKEEKRTVQQLQLEFLGPKPNHNHLPIIFEKGQAKKIYNSLQSRNN